MIIGQTITPITPVMAPSIRLTSNEFFRDKKESRKVNKNKYISPIQAARKQLIAIIHLGGIVEVIIIFNMCV